MTVAFKLNYFAVSGFCMDCKSRIYLYILSAYTYGFLGRIYVYGWGRMPRLTSCCMHILNIYL